MAGFWSKCKVKFLNFIFWGSFNRNHTSLKHRKLKRIHLNSSGFHKVVSMINYLYTTCCGIYKSIALVESSKIIISIITSLCCAFLSYTCFSSVLLEFFLKAKPNKEQFRNNYLLISNPICKCCAVNYAVGSKHKTFSFSEMVFGVWSTPLS